MKSTSGCKLLVHLWLDHPGQVGSFLFWGFLYLSFFSRPPRPRRKARRRRRVVARLSPLSTLSPSVNS